MTGLLAGALPGACPSPLDTSSPGKETEAAVTGMPFGIERRPSRHQRGDGRGSGVFEDRGRGVEGGAGRGDVVHQEDAEPADAARAADPERVAEVGEAVLLAQRGLRRRGAAAGEQRARRGSPRRAASGRAIRSAWL